MTQEQKVKAYDEAIDKVAYFIKKHVGFGCIIHPNSSEAKELFNIFPELKESDDDMIRKALIDYFDDANKADENPLQSYGIHTDKAIAWLEKQASKPQGKTALEAIHEEKVDNANKIEPKFHEGEWIVNDYCMGKVIELTDDAYLLDTGQGIPFSCEHNVHLWTIADAKDGDVLFEDKISSHPSPFIVIFKKKDSVNTFSSYCFIGFDGKFYEGEDEHYSENLHPANKEQRDLLFERMHEAGYTFDFEKKELKKIHVIDEGKDELDYCFTKMMNGEKVEPQSPTTTSCSEELDAKMYEACDRFFAPNTDPNKYSAADLFYAGVEAGCDLNMLSWSEEDENVLKAIINTVKNSGYIHCRGVSNETMIDWLKSIKERYTWKPSDEQIELLEALVEDNNQRYFYTTLNSLYEQLKKLKGV